MSSELFCRIQLSNVKDYTIVDYDTYLWAAPFTWFLKDCVTGYYVARSVRVDKRVLTLYLHREVLGDIDDGFEGHHKDGNILNNRRNNLQLRPKGTHQITVNSVCG